MPQAAPVPLMPSMPPGVDPTRFLFAASICAAAYSGSEVGCRSHPPFKLPGQKPDGRVTEHSPNPAGFCAIGPIYRGSFTRPGASEAVLTFRPCVDESADWNMSIPGSAVLAEEIGGRWVATGYLADTNIGNCLKSHRATGRDLLLCRSDFGTFTGGMIEYFFLLDFAPAGAQAGTFSRLYGSTVACSWINASTSGPDADGAMSYVTGAGLVDMRVKDVSLADVDHDGTDDLVVHVLRSRLPPSAALRLRVREWCKAHDDAAPTALLPPAKAVTLEFLSRAETVVPAPATRKLLDAWDADGFNDLGSIGLPLLRRDSLPR